MRRFSPALALLLLLALPLQAACSRSHAADRGAVDDNRHLSLRIYSTGSTTPNLLLNVPITVISTAVRIATIAQAFGARIEISDLGPGRRTTVDLEDIDLSAILEALRVMKPGPILQLEEENGERLEIWVN